MKKMSQKISVKGAPIVFIHYGDTPYLKYTLSSAKEQNPDKEVFLLGDDNNKKYEQMLNIKHIPFVKYDASEEIRRFYKNFKYLGGTNRQTAQDKRFELFCHVRWFYLNEFMERMGCKKCWYFDSDTLILSPLSGEEAKFDAYDITEQSNGSMMKGLIRFQFIEQFTKTMNDLFSTNEYMESQRTDIEQNPDWALSDMRAYTEYKSKYHPNTIALNTILKNGTHDECICQDDGMETEYASELKRTIKKLYFKDGYIYEKIKTTGVLIKLHTINMSWVTTAMIQKVYYYTVHGTFPPFYTVLWSKVLRLPRFIKTKITKETK